MTAKAKLSITFSQQIKMLGKTSSLIRKDEKYTSKLIDKGYTSFLPWRNFQDVFCQYDQYENKYDCQYKDNVWKFESPDGLKINGIGKEIDYCLCIHRKVNSFDSVIARQRRETIGRIYIEYRQQEFDRFTPQRLIYNHSNYASYFGATLVEAFEPAGFVFDAYRSGEEFPVISKPITSDWDICWSPESNRTLLWPPRQRSGDIARMSQLDLRCYVRARGRRGPAYIPIGFKTLDMMRIGVMFFEKGFGWAYMRFDGAEELPLVMGAHACLYGLVAHDLESMLQAELLAPD